ncbi:MAG: hypothetical protein M3Q75_05965 [Gemmatimonadota bacterium]|nr:hypothetical protein [Gemmatimonadota bacterium]
MTPEAPLLPRPEVLRAIGAPYRQLVADYYWVQTLQAVGRANSPQTARSIFDYARLVGELDPAFREVYVFAAAAIAWPLPDGSYANTAESTRLLEIGHQRIPDHVLLGILLAYNLSTYQGEHLRAARILEQIAKLPGAPAYLPGYATRMYAQGGDFDASLALTNALIDQSRDPDTRRNFEERRQEILLTRHLEQIDQASERFLAREGRWPGAVEELVRTGDLPGRPQDPLGGDIQVGRDGKAFSTASRARFGLFQESPSPP